MPHEPKDIAILYNQIIANTSYLYPSHSIASSHKAGMTHNIIIDVFLTPPGSLYATVYKACVVCGWEMRSVLEAEGWTERLALENLLWVSGKRVGERMRGFEGRC